MKYTKGLVSVVIPTYKRSEKLGRAIESVLKQTYSNVEVLVVSDNEPNDEYSEAARILINSMHDDRVKFVLQDHHKNGAAARNAGIREAKGEFIAFLDDDDYWENRKIELQLEVLKSLDSSWGAVTCKNKHYSNGKLVAALPGYRDGDLCKRILTRVVDVSTDTILAKRKCLDETGYFDERLKRHQEVQLMAFFTSKYKVKLLDMYLVCVDSTGNENQPDPERMEKIKKEFLHCVEPVMAAMSDSDRRDIIIMNEFELGLLYIRTGNRVKGIKKCMKIFRKPNTLYYGFRIVVKKINARLLRRIRYNHDSYTRMAITERN